MTSVALEWSSAFESASDLKTYRKGEPNRKADYNPRTYYNENGELVMCSFDSYPLRDLQHDFTRERDPLPKRVDRWLRHIARSDAEGHDVPFGEDDEDVRQERIANSSGEWPEWGAVTNDWLDTMDDGTGPVEPDPLADQISDPKLMADFKFVAKTAKKRKLSEKDARRLHIVYRVQAPTEEKVKRIKDMINSLLPLVLLENTKNGSGSSSSTSPRKTSSRRWK